MRLVTLVLVLCLQSASALQAGELYAFKEKGLYGYRDEESGEVAVPPRFDEVDRFEEGLAPASEGGVWGVLGSRGNWVIQPAFQSIRTFSKGRALAQKGGLWGCIDRQGRWILPPLYEDVQELSQGYFLVLLK